MIILKSTIFICFLHFLGVFLSTSLILILCKKSKTSANLDSDSTKREQQTLKEAELESQLLELLEELSDSKRKKKKKKHKKRRKHREKKRRKSKKKEDGPEDAPRKIPLNEKEMRIAKGAKVASGDYPTMDNVKSDWDPE